MSSKKCTSLTIEQKLSIIAEAEELSKSELCSKYGCSAATLNRIIRNAKSITEKSKVFNLSCKRERYGAHADVERALKLWYDQRKGSGAEISSSLLLITAKELAIKMNQDFTPTSGWLWRWQRRGGVLTKQRRAKPGLPDNAKADVCNTTILQTLISGYGKADIFNAAETGLYFKTLPTSTYIKRECDVEDLNSTKERLTLIFICNATGDYKHVFVVGKLKSPSCFKNNVLPLNYYADKAALATAEIWNDILTSLDAEMIYLNRKIILLVSNTSLFYKILVKLKNINIQFLPANKTSLIQSPEPDIIQCFKAHYTQCLMRKQFAAVERGESLEEFSKSIDLLQAMHTIKYCFWLVKPETISMAFDKANLTCTQPAGHLHFLADLSETVVPHDVDQVLNAFEDNTLFCNDQLIDPRILESSSNDLISDDSESTAEEEIVPNPPTASEALQSIKCLRSYFLANDKFSLELENMEADIMEHKFQQTMEYSITEFCKPES